MLEGGGADAGDGELSAAGEDAGGVCDDGGESSSPVLEAGGVPPGGWFPVLLMSRHPRSRSYRLPTKHHYPAPLSPAFPPDFTILAPTIVFAVGYVIFVCGMGIPVRDVPLIT